MDNAMPIVLFLSGVLVTLVGYVFITAVQDLKKRVGVLETHSLKEATYKEGISRIEALYKELDSKVDSMIHKLDAEYVQKDVCTADKIVMSKEVENTLKMVSSELEVIKSEMSSIKGIVEGLKEWKSFQEGKQAQ